MSSNKPLTIGELIEYLIPDWGRFQPFWPPDVYALATAILQRSGAYSKVVMGSWPPQAHSASWPRYIRALGRSWRSAVIRKKKAPAEVIRWWQNVASVAHIPVREVHCNSSLVDSLIQLCAVADEASAGLGLPTKNTDRYEDEAFDLLDPGRQGGSTLCKAVDGSRCRVLPKMHVPQSGITVRSLSHHLALCWSADIELDWITAPNAGFAKRVNLLLVPWPFEIMPRQFAQRAGKPLRNMGGQFGFFDFHTGPEQRLPDILRGLLQNAEQTVGELDGVVLPEVAISEQIFEQLAEVVLKRAKFIVCGVKGSGDCGFASNRVRFRFRIGASVGEVKQPKHHRWLLEPIS